MFRKLTSNNGSCLVFGYFRTKKYKCQNEKYNGYKRHGKKEYYITRLSLKFKIEKILPELRKETTFYTVNQEFTIVLLSFTI